jgi:rhodanese-related sulfurtransferase
VHGLAVDVAVGDLLLQTVAPAAIEVALAVQAEIAQRIEQAGARRLAQLERARYEAELARRRYAKVDPDNRLVVDALEADWNQRLRDLDHLQREHERQQQDEQAQLDAPARQRITDLARDFPRVWNDSRTSALERKRMLALLIEDVTLMAGTSIAVHVRWRGGRTQSLFVDKPRPIAQIRKTPPDVVKLIDELLETSTDAQVAERLKEFDRYKSKPVIVHCRNGQRSGSATNTLRKAGFAEAVKLRDGLTAWEQANLPIQKGTKG